MIDPVPDSDSDWLISVIVPAHNSEATLGETLGSIARQRHRRLEILIVDDGSTDGTVALAEKFCAVEPRARLFVQANGGVAAARNAGLRHARGDYVAPIDGDDVWHPDHLSYLIEAMRDSEPRYGFVAARHRQIDRQSRIIGSSPPIRCRSDAVDALLFQNFVGNGSALLLDRAAAIEAGGYDERLRQAGLEGCEDYLLQLCVAASHPVAVVDVFTVGYRRLTTSMSSNVQRLVESGRLAVALFLREHDVARRRPTQWRAPLARLTMRDHWARGSHLKAAFALFKAFLLDFRGTTGALVAYMLLIAFGRQRANARPAFDLTDPRLELDTPIDRARRTASRWIYGTGRAGHRSMQRQPAILSPSRAATSAASPEA